MFLSLAGASQSGCEVCALAHPARQVGPSPQADESHVTRGDVQLKSKITKFNIFIVQFAIWLLP